MNKKPTREQLEQDVLSDMPWNQIAEKYGYTDSRFLRKWAKIWNLPPRRVILKPSKEQLEQLILVDKLPIKDIAEKLGYGEGGWSNIYAFCREYGISFDFTINAELREVEFTREQKSFVFGTLLGDGYLRPSTTRENKKYSLIIAHGEKQKEYLHWKKELLTPFITIDHPYIKKSTSGLNHSPTHSYHTIAHPWLTEIREWLYPNGVKTITERWLNEVDELALAVWFMDDGSLNKRYGTMLFSTNCFSYDEHILMQEWFKKRWNLETVIEKRRNNQHAIRVNASIAPRLREIISPYIPDCMRYKVDFKS